MSEIWVKLRAKNGYKQDYEISNLGNVRYKKGSKYRSTVTKKINGKKYCVLTTKSGKRVEKQICAMVVHYFPKQKEVEVKEEKQTEEQVISPDKLLDNLERIGSTILM